MTDCDILKFNAFNAWIAAGNMTKLVVARQQARMIGNENEATKQLTIRHIQQWEQYCFEPIYSKLERHMPKYIANALLESTSPSDLHGQLLVASSKLLADCLNNNCLTYPTFVSIRSWFSTIHLLKNEPLFAQLSDKHVQLLLVYAEKCATMEHKIFAHMSNFALFCPILLMVVLEHVVNMKFSKIPEMKEQHFDWSVACGISLSGYLFPELCENDGDIFFSCKFSVDELQKLSPDCSKPIHAFNIFKSCAKKVYSRTQSTNGVISSTEQAQIQVFHYQYQSFKPVYLSQLSNQQKQILHYKRQRIKDGKTYTGKDHFETLNDNFFLFGDYYKRVFEKWGDMV
jgi:hypothetical protein